MEVRLEEAVVDWTVVVQDVGAEWAELGVTIVAGSFRAVLLSGSVGSAGAGPEDGEILGCCMTLATVVGAVHVLGELSRTVLV